MDALSPHSYWNQTRGVSGTTYPALKGDLQVDVAIIGAGITGLTAAMYLKETGRNVAILEAGRVGAGTTGGTSAHLDALPDQGSENLIQDFGEEAARAVTGARMAAISQIETWSRAVAANCDFQRIPAYYYSESTAGADQLEQECEAARKLGLDVSPVTAPDLGLPFSNYGGFRIENQGRFHILRYLAALAERFRAEGGAIYEQTPARPPTDGTPCTIETEDGQVAAETVLVCTHSAFLGKSQFDMEIAPYQSYMLAARLADPIPDALYWDDADPYHYTRRASSDDPQLVLIGGADHKTGQGGDEREAFHRLEQYARERYSVEQIEHRWSSEFFEPADGLPYVGRVPFSKHLYISTGYSGTGLTFGTLAGKLLAEVVLGRPSQLAEILSPARLKPLAAGATLLSENMNVVRRYVTDRFTAEPIDSLDEVAVGVGVLAKYRGKQWAIYRDEEGAVHVLAPECTHMGCHVQWNEAERTWDCPCHGGRFSALGERMFGPPANHLEEQPLDEL